MKFKNTFLIISIMGTYAFGVFHCSNEDPTVDVSGGDAERLVTSDVGHREDTPQTEAEEDYADQEDDRSRRGDDPEEEEQATWQDEYAEKNSDSLRNGIGGWNVLSEDYRKPNLFDGLSLEWDYFSIHDKDGKFTGVVSYLVADPMGYLGDPGYVWEPNLMTSGGNMACFGKVGSTGEKYADFVAFGLDFEADNDERSFYAMSDDGDYWGEMIPVKGTDNNPDSLILLGQTKNFEWELTVTQLWAGDHSLSEYSEPDYHALKDKTWVVGNDIHLNILKKEHWTVNMLWPSTKVNGWIIDQNTGEHMEIDGHGYRENSFGRWIFPLGGWDFYYMSDLENKVQFGFQTYVHQTEDLDYLDVDFLDNGEPVSVRFMAKNGELGWYHNEWKWSDESHQCRPLDAVIIGKNKDYTVESYIDNQDNYAVLLSDVTPITSAFQITTLFPIFSGTIKRNDTGEIVSRFYGQGGGEFSLKKRFSSTSDNLCNYFMRSYNYPVPE